MQIHTLKQQTKKTGQNTLCLKYKQTRFTPRDINKKKLQLRNNKQSKKNSHRRHKKTMAKQEKGLIKLTEQQKQMSDLFVMAKEAEGESLALDYKKFESGETEMLLFLGLTEMEDTLNPKNEGEMKTVVMFQDENFQKSINADSVIISTLRKEKKQCIVEITCTGEQKGKKGTYQTFNIIRKAVSNLDATQI